MTMFKSIQILLTIIAFYDYEMWQMDVKTAFLNGDLEEDVYMTQPMDFKDTNNTSKVCKLKRSILYVNDILLIGNCIPTLDEVKSSLKKVFSMKDLDETTYILGIKIYRDRF
jgi:esterase/lipase superfamily enzyme